MPSKTISGFSRYDALIRWIEATMLQAADSYYGEGFQIIIVKCESLEQIKHESSITYEKNAQKIFT